MKILFLIFCLFLESCASVTQPLDTSTNYMKDVPFKVNGVSYVGVGVAAKTPSYTIEIDYPYGKINVLTLDSCHRNIKEEPNSSKATYYFSPSALELEDSCMLEIGIYDLKGRDGWILIQFEEDLATLIGLEECNGETLHALGISICQSKVGTLQRISFNDPVKYKTSDPSCKLTQNENSYEYEVVSGYCYFTFMDDRGAYHKHTVYGYQGPIIRGN